MKLRLYYIVRLAKRCGRLRFRQRGTFSTFDVEESEYYDGVFRVVSGWMR